MSDTDGTGSFINASASDVSASQPSIIDPPLNHEDEEIDSLPSEPDSDEVTISDDYSESDAEREWKESLQQLEMLLSMVIVPYMGKYFGRKFAYWGKLCPEVMEAPEQTLMFYTGWKQYMEWKYPVEILITDKGRFRATGMVEAAAAL